MQQCQDITRRSASNLALAFVLLPRPKREAMSALYAFCREVDDAADTESLPVAERRAALGRWRDDVRRACTGGIPEMAVNRELQPCIQRYALPFELFDALIQGVEMDLDVHRYADFDQLDQYCYRVASVVGLLSIEIFGYRNPACREYAVALGKALQLTNILRDVRSDALRGRIYLPLSELQRAGCDPESILRSEYSPQFFEAANAVAQRARHFYRMAGNRLPQEDRRSMAAAELMGSVYWDLLQKLAARRFNVFAEPKTRLSTLHKAALIFRTWLRVFSGAVVPNYGTS